MGSTLVGHNGQVDSVTVRTHVKDKADSIKRGPCSDQTRDLTWPMVQLQAATGLTAKMSVSALSVSVQEPIPRNTAAQGTAMLPMCRWRSQAGVNCHADDEACIAVPGPRAWPCALPPTRGVALGSHVGSTWQHQGA